MDGTVHERTLLGVTNGEDFPLGWGMPTGLGRSSHQRDKGVAYELLTVLLRTVTRWPYLTNNDYWCKLQQG